MAGAVATALLTLSLSSCSTKPGAATAATSPPASATTSPLGFANTGFRSRSQIDQLAVDGPRLVLSGALQETATPTPTANLPACVSMTVDPVTLNIGPAVGAACNDPRLLGKRVGIAINDLPQSNTATVSIATVDAAGQVTNGPPVMTFGRSSDSNPVTAYGGSSLWIYDVDTDQGPELLRVSTDTGQLEATLPVPQLYKPVLAAGEGYVWIGNSINGSSGPDALYVVRRGATAATPVITDPTAVACWLVADADQLWAGLGTAQ